ncbi:CDP-alcohol phosphatidyltransferase family protein [Arthrobacter rhombi]|uniref:CDP-alcohol phosphatidyltransferase family protein n=1 Tax=Arthrobacter rhombi TaxID=71253 RepID=UPI003FD37BD5
MNVYQTALGTLAAKQKSPRGVSFYSLWVNRPAGRRLAAMAYVLGMSPNQVSLSSGAVTAGGIIIVATAAPTWIAGLAAWFMLTLGFMLDAADGQLARLQGCSSPAGEWLDHVLDAGKMVAVHTAVLISWARFFDLSLPMLLVPLVFQFAAVVTFTGGTLAGLLKRPEAQGRPLRQHSKTRSFLLLSVDYGIFCTVFLAFGSPSAFVFIYTALAVIRLAWTVAFSFKWFKELAQ